MNDAERLAGVRRALRASERGLKRTRAELAAAHERIVAQARMLNDERARQRTLREDRRGVLAELARADADVQIAQRRLGNALETIRDGFAVFDSDLRLVAVNRTFAAFFAEAFTVTCGITYEEMIRLTAERGLLDQTRAAGDAWVAMMLDRVRKPRPRTVVVPIADGRSLRVIDRWGQGGDLVCHAADITQTLRHEADLAEALRRAEGASRAKSAFLANMSHEIRTPMNGIVGMAELLCDSGLADDQRLYAETIKSSGDALLAIINDILDMSKAEADRLSLHPEPMTLRACLSEVAMLVMSSVRDKGLSLTLDVDPALPDRFIADPLRLRQIVTNLVGNAVKFTAEGHVTLHAHGAEREDGRWRVTLCVEDSGIGIAPADQRMIFGEFAQVETATSRQYQGTGLGLAIVSELARLMEAEVRVDSALGEGACFYIELTLPLAPDARRPDASAFALPAHLRRVLLVSDHGVRAPMLSRLLASWGVTCVIVPDPQAAVAVLSRGGIDAVLADHSPDEVEARPLTAAMASLGLRVPLIAMTECAATTEARDPGIFSAILALPVGTAALRAALRCVPRPPVAEAMTRRPGAPVPCPPAPCPPAARQIRVLAAEDNRINQLVLRKMLEPMGVQISFADNGRDAIFAWRRLSPDLIFMDVSMPVMDGVEATRRIRAAEARDAARDSQTPAITGDAAPDGGCGGGDPVEDRRPPQRVAIIALTAHPSDAISPILKEAGADDILSKPFRRADLVAAMARFALLDQLPADLPVNATIASEGAA